MDFAAGKIALMAGLHRKAADRPATNTVEGLSERSQSSWPQAARAPLLRGLAISVLNKILKIMTNVEGNNHKGSIRRTPYAD